MSTDLLLQDAFAKQVSNLPGLLLHHLCRILVQLFSFSVRDGYIHVYVTGRLIARKAITVYIRVQNIRIMAPSIRQHSCFLRRNTYSSYSKAFHALVVTLLYAMLIFFEIFISLRFFSTSCK
jgi:hypothetical protein